MKDWQKKEKKDAKDLNAKLVPRSGGFWSNKGDLRDDYFNYDSKHTKHASYSIKSKVWEKVYNDALKHNRMPALSIELGTGEELIVLSKADFAYLKSEFETHQLEKISVKNQGE